MACASQPHKIESLNQINYRASAWFFLIRIKVALAERAVLVVGAHAPPVILLKHLLHSQMPAAILLTAFLLVHFTAKPTRVSHSLRDFVFFGDFS